MVCRDGWLSTDSSASASDVPAALRRDNLLSSLFHAPCCFSVRRVYTNGRLDHKDTATDYYPDTIFDPPCVPRLEKDESLLMPVKSFYGASKPRIGNIRFR